MISLPQATLGIAVDLSNAEKGRRAASRLGDSLGSRLLRNSPEPVDIQSVATSEDIRVVQAAGLTESGRIEWTGGGLRIVLRETDGERRQRFTLAHELAHHLLFGVEKDRKHRYSREEETRCDRFAAGLLMPKRKFAAAFRGQSDLPRTTAVLGLSERFGVSLRSAMIRLNDLGLVDHTWILLLVELNARGERCVSAAAYDKSVYRPLERMTMQELGIDRGLGRAMTMPLEAGGVVASVRLPTKQRGLPRGSPNFLPGVITCAPLDRASNQLLADIDLVIDPLRLRIRKPPTALQANLFEETELTGASSPPASPTPRTRRP